MNITLQEDNELLDEVVVIGYGSVKRKDVTTSRIYGFYKAIWTNAPLYRQPKPYKVKQPACRLCAAHGEPGGGMSIRVRGTTSFNGSNAPALRSGWCTCGQHQLSPNDIENSLF